MAFLSPGCGVVVLRGDEDKPVVGSDLGRPDLGVLMGVVMHRRWLGFVKHGQVEVGHVDEVVLGPRPVLRVLPYPFSDLLAVTAGARAADDDPNLQLRKNFPIVGSGAAAVAQRRDASLS
jgi:hypothetical protein